VTRAAVVLLLALGAWPVAAAAQTTDTRFPMLLADPREPAFFATYLWSRSERLGPRLGTVGLGQTIPLVHSASWEVAIAAGVFSQFSMASATNDLINTDYRVGLPLTYRHGAFATRFQLYHQSSHLGDEYLLHTGARRTDLTFESAELLLSHQTVPWRVYGGVEYAFVRSPSDLKPALIRAGLEYRAADPLVRLGRFAAGRLVAALDVAASQARGWLPGWSLVSGVEMTTPQSLWHWSLLLRAYSGPTPYGQFYRDALSSIGAGIAFAR